jgi:hypothetical protein
MSCHYNMNNYELYGDQITKHQYRLINKDCAIIKNKDIDELYFLIHDSFLINEIIVLHNITRTEQNFIYFNPVKLVLNSFYLRNDKINTTNTKYLSIECDCSGFRNLNYVPIHFRSKMNKCNNLSNTLFFYGNVFCYNYYMPSSVIIYEGLCCSKQLNNIPNKIKFIKLQFYCDKNILNKYKKILFTKIVYTSCLKYDNESQENLINIIKHKNNACCL